DKWSFGYDMHMEDVQKLTPLERASRHNGEVEEMAVTPAQHPITNVGKCWRPGTGEPALNGLDMPARAFVPATGKEEADPVRWGIYFQDRWDEALQVDPPFIYLNDWNEWVAGRYVSGKDPGGHVPGPTGFIGRENPFYFVDQYNAEFNRTIQPMRGGYTDNYYMQMVQNIRRYKGVRPSPVQSHYATQLRIDGRFDDWADVECVYRDTRGDVIHRNHPGYGTAVYTDNTGRNDIVLCRAATDRRNAYFYVETAAALTPHTDRCWMLLYIDLDADPTTGWQGYDLLVRGYDPQVGTVGVYIYDKENRRFADLPRLQVPCAIGERQIELAIPLRKVGVKDKEVFFDFKWTDNARDPYDLISISTTGDTAPNRRFAYRFSEKGAGKGPSFARARTK
ncbi:MAG: hypothetical protein HUK03_07225, partial [Bacteroidaceae bacterium]|nr:hypothetical protein [Bacteroidaceae bacterium]